MEQTQIRPDNTIQTGLWWDLDGHNLTITEVDQDNASCVVTETWINEDTLEDMEHTDTYSIGTNENGSQYAYKDSFVLYANSAFNYPHLLDKYEEAEECDEEEYYTPSCTAGDYGPSNPWDAPGMSIHDFI